MDTIASRYASALLELAIENDKVNTYQSQIKYVLSIYRENKELDELVSSDIDDTLKEHLLVQIQNLPNAYITNFHGFCSLLLKKYGYLVDVLWRYGRR